MSFNAMLQQMEATDQQLQKARELTALGELSQAESICREALANLIEWYGKQSIKTSTCLLELADVCFLRKKYEDVIECLITVLNNNQVDQFLTDEQELSAQFRIAKSLEKTGFIDESIDLYSSLLERTEKTMGASAPFTKSVAASLKSLVQRQGKASDIDLEKLSSFDNDNASFCRQGRHLRRVFRERDTSRSLCRASDAAAEKRWIVGRYASLFAASLLCVWFLVAGVMTDHDPQQKRGTADATAAYVATTPGALANYIGDYQSSDGLETLHIDKSKQGVFARHGQTISGSIDEVATEIHLQPTKGKLQLFRTSGQSLVSDSGATMFRSGSPELSTTDRVNRATEMLNQFYQVRGRYPNSLGECQYTLRSLEANSQMIFHCVGEGKKLVTIDDYTAFSSEETNYLSQVNKHAPSGTIEIIVNLMANNGTQSVTVRGYDRNGNLIPSSVPGHCFSKFSVAGRLGA